MPTYEYKCQCGYFFEEFKGIHDPHPVQCPRCGIGYGQGFEQNFAGHSVVCWVGDNPTTVGQLGERNAKRIGKEQLSKRYDKPKKELPFWRNGEDGVEKLEKPLDLKSIKNVEKYIHTGDKD